MGMVADKKVASLLESQGFYSQIEKKSGISLSTLQDVVTQPVNKSCVEPTNKMNAVRSTPANKQAVQSLADLTKDVRNIVAGAPQNISDTSAKQSLSDQEEILFQIS